MIRPPRRSLARWTLSLTVCLAGAAPATRPAAPVFPVSGTDTAAVQSAIDAAAAAGGGVVDVPAGTYAVTPIRLRSHVELHLDRGALLKFSRTFADYPLTWVDDGRGREAACSSPVWADAATDVAITGEGVIDGSGDAWRSVKRSKLSDADWAALVRSGGVVGPKGDEWFPTAVSRDGGKRLAKLSAVKPPAPLAAYEPFRPLLRPHMIRLMNCRRVRLDGVTFRNSPMWNVHLALCDDVTVHGITIFNVAWAQNGDGIDLDSCRHVTMTDSHVDAGDDAICLKSGQNEAGRARARPTEDVTVSRCTVGTGHGGVVIGSEMSGGVRHVRVDHCTFTGTDNGLRFKSVRGRGGVVEDVVCTDIRMAGIGNAFENGKPTDGRTADGDKKSPEGEKKLNAGGVAVLFDLYYFTKPTTAPAPPAGEGTPAFRDFHISRVTCDGAKQAVLIRGLPERPLHDVTLDDVTLSARTAGLIKDADGVVCRDVHVTAADGSRVKVSDAPGLKLVDSTGFQP